MKENLLTKTAELAMYVTLSYIREGDFAVDATCGNGHDTLALARAVGTAGTVLAVDLQEAAVASCGKLLREHRIENTIQVCGNFLHLDRYIGEKAEGRNPRAVVFNLGYLPGGDKEITTRSRDTVQAAAKAADLVEPGGIVTLVMYPGHREGSLERKALLEWAETLDAGRYHTVYASLPNQKKNPPEILWITRKDTRREKP